MTDLDDRDTPFYWTTLFVRTLVDHGVQHVVISPGSRSTPLTLAAAAHPALKKHIILDERSAAFTALGIGKATGTPPVLVCTSGTALANYYPAVIEARQSGIPLILATADRPPHLRATGANQAIDQLKIFGDYPVFFHEVGEPRSAQIDRNRLQMLARQTISMAQDKRGPVHLNFPFRKPLEPNPAFVTKIEEENRADSPSSQYDSSRAVFPITDAIKRVIAKSKRPLIIVGPTAANDDTSTVAALAEKLHCPILTESTVDSKYTIEGFAGFLRNKKVAKQHQPDLILRFGFQPTAKALEVALKEWNCTNHYHFASTDDWQDATFSGSRHLPWLGKKLLLEEVSASTDTAWLNHWQQTEAAFDNHFEQSIGQSKTITDGHIYTEILPQCNEDKFIAVSNSFPARDIQLFGPKATQYDLFLNRGASGIDGVTSTAMGISLATQQPGVLFTGDLAFLHDSNALLSQKIIDQHLTIIVINNSGGSIFRMLPIEQHDNYFKEYFETPQSVDIQQLVAAHDIPFHRITTLAKLQNFDLNKWQADHSGLSVIECQTDADASMKLRKNIWDFQ
ncbi:2-succinyl-5-enolpyruvyl-6-hydroxy-3-cyclohexene-1-carboxylic-acid synthase [Fodinibius salsisoli]|uniref:2-succinyl-5-enolpyruvyl-6-hydroxy-3-cyclohexene-1-carboxylate synthase n=1 Tax=Fodinibius salsisoli TaxID=2820877 RepID=A0ABT3PNC0_9BACT|nr:2-succinyl-5-enolpyruvyl-6-hydroxy-3-cyclohexene-1-carboxylic-acid synthase [Fodinibius salsisoli]MCW9707383.1 2-succinyl-5-enolpyruvyl-6-hydroxy-3-cyclohexene-1-carboxylic-acid synthase [Fodinibius salsisoli]